MIDLVLKGAVLVALGGPALAFLVLSALAWAQRPFDERFTSGVVGTGLLASTLAAVVAAAVMMAEGRTEIRVPLGAWFELGHYGFHWNLILDRLSVPFAIFGAGLTGLIGAFSQRYLHRESGFARFYVLLVLFGAGVQLVVLAGSLDLAFFGWELVGVSSALLIAFFHERPAPVRHGLRAFVTYRACDVGLLAAVVWLHHTVGHARISEAVEPWAGLGVPENILDASFVGLLLLWATMGKSAQVPLGGWLPRAMEGPTPSSAIFYGALSIHLGPYLLLRAAPILERAPIAAAALVLIGAATAMHATFVGRAQSDIKSALAYASMTQVGLIFVEIGLGLRFLALVHIVGHASVRALQILRSPSLLHDHHHLEQAVGQALPRPGGHLERLVPARLQPWLYRLALERGYFDALIVEHLVGRAARVLRAVDRVDAAWVRWLSGGAPSSELAEPVESREVVR